MGKKRAKNRGGTGEKAPPFPPGESGNAAGRPKGSKDGFRAHLNRRLRKMAPADAIQGCKDLGVEMDDGTVAEVLAGILVGLAFKGEPPDRLRAIDKIEKTTEEPMKQTHELTGSLGLHNMTDEQILELAQDAERTESK